MTNYNNLPRTQHQYEIELPDADYLVHGQNKAPIVGEIKNDPLLGAIDKKDREAVLSSVAELYEKSKDIVGPAVVNFADDILHHANGSQIVFAARDGIGALLASQELLKRFPEKYNGASENDLVYSFLTRKIVFNTQYDRLARYLQECGVKDLEAPITLIDIGMYGSIVHDLKRLMPNLTVRYLISKSPDIEGYIDNPYKGVRMASLDTVVGNPAVHFLEDTYSGNTSSADTLIINELGELTPNFQENPYPPDELLKRKYALRGIVDCVRSLESAPSQNNKAKIVATLDTFLMNKNNYSDLMVPHAKG